jgi:hypothetical protein
LDHLRPFVSLLLAKSSEDEAGDELFQRILLDCIGLSQVESDRKRRGLAAEPKVEAFDAVQVGALLVEELVRPAWTNQADIWDRRNHVVIVLRLANLYAIHVSDPGLRASITSRIGSNQVPGLGALSLIPPSVMNAAFIQGVTRTVWLRGIHRPTSLKSDTKMLSGSDLDHAIDPLGDQSYHFTAVRCVFDSGESRLTIGVAPSESRIWISRAGNWAAFKTAAIAALTEVQDARNPSFAPIRFLAVPGAGGAEVSQAFDMGLYPVEMMDGGGDDQYREDRERDASQFAFQVIPQDGPNLTAVVARRGVRIGLISLHFAFEEEQVICNAATIADDDRHTEDLRKVQGLCEDGDMLIVRYDSEHVISGSTLYRYHFRDHPFSGYGWVDLQDWSISSEKPSALERIGEEESLFCWVWWRWSGLLDAEFGGGWLACDDGAGEKADFIHFDERAQVLSLIHVKASDSDSNQRSVAVAKYEVVVSQAIKNLRFLDRDNLRDGLRARVNREGRVLTWCGGEPCERAAFNEALSRIQARCARRIIIVQPHLRKEVWERADANPDSQEGGRLRQLNTLLIAAESSCRGLGASLTVIGAA